MFSISKNNNNSEPSDLLILCIINRLYKYYIKNNKLYDEVLYEIFISECN